MWLVDYTVDIHNEDDVVGDDVGDDDVDADDDDDDDDVGDVYALMISVIKTKTIATRMVVLQSETHLQKESLQEKRCFQLPSADLDSTTLEKCSTQLGAPKCRFVFVLVFVLCSQVQVSKYQLSSPSLVTKPPVLHCGIRCKT